ncbi:hypothetical protein R69746_08354 [Paraburkholderia aspalathi]|uniref:hypothetical protein n=1 Tax=Paraburkholderia aspalathi TaxID=1324617 RepID=UPI00190CED10|nr:hypothetical protein [Paraburkholderia aspalathi]MBK3844263.1 hypothetical protein [Paraburkholderia aspalathi]CAE6870128.1 hypothetical protein R69746_08354 [Paraburkholderia aspalathi]
MFNDDQIMLQAQNAGFNADVAYVVRTIAASHRARGAVLTWQLVRDIREEALDIMYGPAAPQGTRIKLEVGYTAAQSRIEGGRS